MNFGLQGTDPSQISMSSSHVWVVGVCGSAAIGVKTGVLCSALESLGSLSDVRVGTLDEAMSEGETLRAAGPVWALR